MTASNLPETINDNLRLAVAQAIHRVQGQIRWKPGKDIQHLAKRIRLKHLPPQATLADYETIIASILSDNEAKIYLFLYDNSSYPTVVSTLQDKLWLVMIGLDGLMETAFPPDDPETYLSDPAYIYIGLLKEFYYE